MPQDTEQQVVRRPRRQCYPHERVWQNHCVDINLEDAWLESLNSLVAFDLISICEGHATSGRGIGSRSPHINLRIKESLLPVAVHEFDRSGGNLQKQLLKLFGNGHSSVEVEFRVRLFSSRKRESVERDLVVKINARPHRTSESFDEVTRLWFHSTVASVQSLDLIFAKLLKENGNEA